VDMLKKMDQEGRAVGYHIPLEGCCSPAQAVGGGMFGVWDPSWAIERSSVLIFRLKGEGCNVEIDVEGR
jgi:hypothetical protein